MAAMSIYVYRQISKITQEQSPVSSASNNPRCHPTDHPQGVPKQTRDPTPQHTGPKGSAVTVLVPALQDTPKGHLFMP